MVETEAIYESDDQKESGKLDEQIRSAFLLLHAACKGASLGILKRYPMEIIEG